MGVIYRLTPESPEQVSSGRVEQFPDLADKTLSVGIRIRENLFDVNRLSGVVDHRIVTAKAIAMRVVDIRFHAEAHRIVATLEKLRVWMAGRDIQVHSFALAVRGSELDIPTGKTALVAVVENEALRIRAVLVIGFDSLVGFVDGLHF